MSLLVSLALAASGATLPACSWDRPGVNPFMGDVVAAVDRYTDLPEATRTRLKARMTTRDYDEVVSIGRDAIVGKARYGSEIRQMHFGASSVCNTVTRAKWTQTMQERGLVYCEGAQCIVVPTVCRNVSRITRLAPPAAAAAAAPAPMVAQADPQSQLDTDPTGAGNLGGGAPGASGAAADSASPGSFAQGAGRGFDGGAAPGSGSISLLSLGGNSPAGSPGGASPVGPNLSIAGVPFLPPGVVGGAPQLPPLPAVPEPGTWAMLLLGLLTVGVVARRRKTNV